MCKSEIINQFLTVKFPLRLARPFTVNLKYRKKSNKIALDIVHSDSKGGLTY